MLRVLRYVERNPLRAGLCKRAEDWRYESAWRRESGSEEEQTLLSKWPIPRPRNWLKYLNDPQSEAEQEANRQSVVRGTPFGGEAWVSQSAARLQLKHTLRPRGRPPQKLLLDRNELRPLYYALYYASRGDRRVPSDASAQSRLWDL